MDPKKALDIGGFAVILRIFEPAEVDALVADLEHSLSERAEGAPIRSSLGHVYAARNLLELWPRARTLHLHPQLHNLLLGMLGPGFGVVRGLYFDKPPDRTWALPWHKDLTIAVREHRPSTRFTKPTTKAGVPHVEAPIDVLESMLTVRIHLDDMLDDNGPLEVMPGSHRDGKEMGPTVGAKTIHARRGDVLLIRPLVSHASKSSQPGCDRNRRIVHLECAASRDLGDGFEWHTFIEGKADPLCSTQILT